MRKILTLFIIILSLPVFGQLPFDTVNVGSRIGSRDGDKIRVAFEKVNNVINWVNLDSVGQANRIIPASIDSSVVYYISNTGNDTTGTGTINNPWATIEKALYCTKDEITNASTLTYQLDSGNYTYTGTEVNLLNKKVSTAASVIEIVGYCDTIEQGISVTIDATNNHKWNTGASTWVIDEFKGMYANDGSNNWPILGNGVDYLIIPKSSGLSTITIVSNKTQLNYGAENMFIQPDVKDKALRYKNIILNGTGKLKSGNITPLGLFSFEGVTIICKQMNLANIIIEGSYLNTTGDGFVIPNSGVVMRNTISEGDGGAGDYGIILKSGSMEIEDVILSNFNTGIYYESGISNINVTNQISMYSLNKAFYLSSGSTLMGSQSVYLSNVNYIYNGNNTINVNAIFDFNSIIGTPVIDYIENDNGLRAVPNYNYTVFIDNYHTL